MRHLGLVFLVACGVDGHTSDTASSEFSYETTSSGIPSESSSEESGGTADTAVTGDTEDTVCTTDGRASGEIEACIESYPVSKGFGHGGADLEAIETECIDRSGSYCESEHWITLEAAICIAEELNRLNPYARPLGESTAVLDYSTVFQTAVWSIDSLETGGGPFTEYHHEATLHATTGCRVSASTWGVVY